MPKKGRPTQTQQLHVSEEKKSRDCRPEIHMENVVLSEFDDVSEEYWQDTSLYLVRTATKSEAGEGCVKTTSILAMMPEKEQDGTEEEEEVEEDEEEEEEEEEIETTGMDDHALSSILSSFSGLESEAEDCECPPSQVPASPNPTSDLNPQEFESKQTVKAAAEKLSQVTRKIFSSSQPTSMTLHQLSEQFYHAYRQFVFSIEEGANKKADVNSLSVIIEELNAITESSSRLLLVVNAATVNPSGKEKIADAARDVMTCIDKMIAACSWGKKNSSRVENGKEKPQVGLTGARRVVSAVSLVDGSEHESFRSDSPLNLASKPKVCVKTNREIIRDGLTVNEKYQVCTENTTVTPNTLIKDKTTIRDQKVTTDDGITIKQGVISEQETVTRRPPISPRKNCKCYRVPKKKDFKNYEFSDEDVLIESGDKNNKQDKEILNHPRSLPSRTNSEERETRKRQEIVVDKEQSEPKKIFEQSLASSMSSKKSMAGKKSSPMAAPLRQETKNLSPFNECNCISASRVATNNGENDSESSTTQSLEEFEIKEALHNRLKRVSLDRNSFIMQQLSSGLETDVSTEEEFVSEKSSLRESSGSTDQNFSQTWKSLDGIGSQERECLSNLKFLSQRDITDNPSDLERRGSERKVKALKRRNSSIDREGLLSGETPAQHNASLRRRSSSENRIPKNKGFQTEPSWLGGKEPFIASSVASLQTENPIMKEQGLLTDERRRSSLLISESRRSSEPFIAPSVTSLQTESPIMKEQGLLSDERRRSSLSIPESRRSSESFIAPSVTSLQTESPIMKEQGLLTDERRRSSLSIPESRRSSEPFIAPSVTSLQTESPIMKEQGLLSDERRRSSLSIPESRRSSEPFIAPSVTSLQTESPTMKEQGFLSDERRRSSLSIPESRRSSEPFIAPSVTSLQTESPTMKEQGFLSDERRRSSLSIPESRRSSEPFIAPSVASLQTESPTMKEQGDERRRSSQIFSTETMRITERRMSQERLNTLDKAASETNLNKASSSQLSFRNDIGLSTSQKSLYLEEDSPERSSRRRLSSQRRGSTENLSRTDTGIMTDFVIVKQMRDVFKEQLTTGQKSNEAGFDLEKRELLKRGRSASVDRFLTRRGNTTEPFGTSKEYFAKRKSPIPCESGLPVNRKRPLTVECETNTDPFQYSQAASGRKTPVDSQFLVCPKNTFERGIVTDPWPQVQRRATEERSVGTETIEPPFGMTVAANNLPCLKENKTGINKANQIGENFSSQYSDSEKSEVSQKHCGGDYWKASNAGTSTDASTFRSLSEHYSKDTEETSDIPTNLINLTLENEGTNFELTFNLPPVDFCCQNVIQIEEVHGETSESVSEDSDTKAYPFSRFFNQTTKPDYWKQYVNCRPTIKGGDEDRNRVPSPYPLPKQAYRVESPSINHDPSKPVKGFDSAIINRNDEGSEPIIELQESTTDNSRAISTTPTPTPRSTPTLRTTSTPRTTPTPTSSSTPIPMPILNKNDIALNRALAELKWAHTSINRLESEKKLLHSQLDEVMQTGFQKGKQQIQQLVEAEALLQDFRKRHEQEYKNLVRKNEELMQNASHFLKEKAEFQEKLEEMKRKLENQENQCKQSEESLKNVEISFELEKKQLKNKMAKLENDLTTERTENKKLLESQKTLKNEITKLNEELEKYKEMHRKQSEQLQESKNSSNRLLKRTNSDIVSMQKIHQTMHDNIQRLEKEKSVLEFELRCETNKVAVLQKDMDASWREYNHQRRSCFYHQPKRPFILDGSNPKQMRYALPQCRSQSPSKSMTTMPQDEWDTPKRLTQTPYSQSQVNMFSVSQNSTMLQVRSPSISEPGGSNQQATPHQTFQQTAPPTYNNQSRLSPTYNNQGRLSPHPLIHAGSNPQTPNGFQSQNAMQQNPQNPEAKKYDHNLKKIIEDQKLIKARYEHEQERNRRLQRKLFHLKASEQKKKQLLLAKYERERKRMRLIMEKHKQSSKDATQRLNSADVMLDIEREKNNVLQREITEIKTNNGKKAEMDFVNSSQDFDQLNNRLTHVELGQTIEKVNSYLEQQQLEYQLRMATRENEIALEKQKLQENLLHLRFNYEKILSQNDAPINNVSSSKDLHNQSSSQSSSSSSSSVLNLPYTSKIVFSPNPAWKSSNFSNLTLW